MYVAKYEVFSGKDRLLTKEELIELMCSIAWLSPIYFKKELQSDIIGSYGGKYVYRIISAEEFRIIVAEMADGFFKDLKKYLGEISK